MSIGENIRRARLSKDIRAIDLAEDVGIHQCSLSLIENDKSPGFKVSTFRRICEVLQVSPNSILEWKEVEKTIDSSKTLEEGYYILVKPSVETVR